MSPESFAGFSSSEGGDRSHFTSRPEHTQLKLTTFKPGTKHGPHQARRTSVDDWPEGQNSQDTTAKCTEYTQEAPPEVPGPGHYKDLFFIRPLLSGEGDKTGFSDTEKKTET